MATGKKYLCPAQPACVQCLKCSCSLPGSPQNLLQRSFFTAQVVFTFPFRMISNIAKLQYCNVNTGQYQCLLSDHFVFRPRWRIWQRKKHFNQRWSRTGRQPLQIAAKNNVYHKARLQWHRCYEHFSRFNLTLSPLSSTLWPTFVSMLDSLWTESELASVSLLIQPSPFLECLNRLLVKSFNNNLMVTNPELPISWTGR